jgi:hypothetical protein
MRLPEAVSSVTPVAAARPSALYLGWQGASSTIAQYVAPFTTQELLNLQRRKHYSGPAPDAYQVRQCMLLPQHSLQAPWLHCKTSAAASATHAAWLLSQPQSKIKGKS